MNRSTSSIDRGLSCSLLMYFTYHFSFSVVHEFTLDPFNKNSGVVAQISNGPGKPPITVTRQCSEVIIINPISNQLIYQPSKMYDNSTIIYTFKESVKLINFPVSNEDNPTFKLHFFDVNTPFYYSIQLVDEKGRSWRSSPCYTDTEQLRTISPKSDNMTNIDLTAIIKLCINISSQNNAQGICFKLKPIKVIEGPSLSYSEENSYYQEDSSPTYRRIPTTTGPTATKGTYTATLDPSSGSPDYRRILTTTGPTATKGTYTATLDPEKEPKSDLSNTDEQFSSTSKKSSGFFGHYAPRGTQTYSESSNIFDFTKNNNSYNSDSHHSTQDKENDGIDLKKKLSNKFRSYADNMILDPLDQTLSYRYSKKDTLNLVDPKITYIFDPPYNINNMRSHATNHLQYKPIIIIDFSKINNCFEFSIALNDTKDKVWGSPWIECSPNQSTVYEIPPYKYGLSDDYLDLGSLKSLIIYFTPKGKFNNTYFTVDSVKTSVGLYETSKQSKLKHSLSHVKSKMKEYIIDQFDEDAENESTNNLIREYKNDLTVDQDNEELVCTYNKSSEETEGYPEINYSFDPPLNALQGTIHDENHLAFKIVFSEINIPGNFILDLFDTEGRTWSSSWIECSQNKKNYIIYPLKEGLKKGYIDFNSLESLSIIFAPLDDSQGLDFKLKGIKIVYK